MPWGLCPRSSVHLPCPLGCEQGEHGCFLWWPLDHTYLGRFLRVRGFPGLQEDASCGGFRVHGLNVGSSVLGTSGTVLGTGMQNVSPPVCSAEPLLGPDPSQACTLSVSTGRVCVSPGCSLAMSLTRTDVCVCLQSGWLEQAGISVCKAAVALGGQVSPAHFTLEPEGATKHSWPHPPLEAPGGAGPRLLLLLLALPVHRFGDTAVCFRSVSNLLASGGLFEQLASSLCCKVDLALE